MSDSARAAEVAGERKIDAGLHLNFTTRFSATGVNARLLEHQQRLASYLLRSRFNKVMFHPGLRGSFEYVVAAQFDEFERYYGKRPNRIDGHHHMHLCSNVVFGGLLPEGALVRRNLSFSQGEKSWTNRMYRRIFDGMLERRYRMVDFLFTLPPLHLQGRLKPIYEKAREYVVEVETHPINPSEYRFLRDGEILTWLGDVPIAPCFETPQVPA